MSIRNSLGSSVVLTLLVAAAPALADDIRPDSDARPFADEKCIEQCDTASDQCMQTAEGDPDSGITLWLIDEDGGRHRFWQSFPLVFYAAGPSHRLRALRIFLSGQPLPLRLSRVERRDLFQVNPMHVMGIELEKQEDLQNVFYKAQSAFPDLEFYDVDLSLSLRHAAGFGTFPLAYCEVEVEGHKVESITPLATPWELDAALPPLRVLKLEPDCDPNHSPPRSLKIHYGPRTPKATFSPW